MPRLRRYRCPNPDRRRALELLAESRKGCTKAMMLAHGFSTGMLLDLVKAGLAMVNTERMGTSDRQTDVTHVRITEAGQRALARISK